MKNLFAFLVTLIVVQLNAQSDYYTKKGVAIGGYDVTEYFNGAPKEGMKQYASKYDNVTFYFVTKANKEKFENEPKKYVPQYGGYCAYAIGLKGEKVKIDPKTYEIRNGKLYLFYNSWGTNTLDLWLEKGADQLQAQADKNWKKIKDSK